MKRNPFFSQLSPRFLFTEIKARVARFQDKNPEKKLISLGRGDTTEPLGSSVTQSLLSAASDMNDKHRYTGYGPPQGMEALREKIASVLYHNLVTPDEIFISDGTKCDIGRINVLFGPQAHIAVQEPSYPVYADAARMNRSAETTTFSYLPHSPPDLEMVPQGAVIFLCSPNNPTGDVLTGADLRSLVQTARQRGQFIIFDTAYRSFIRGNFPRSIYEVPEAQKVAIELGSFSKMAGFSGLRLGWTVIPHALKYDDGSSVHQDFIRLMTTVFNGASILSQKAGIQALSEEGQRECSQQCSVYQENTQLLQTAFLKKGVFVSGGLHTPYLWVPTGSKSSWDAFDYYLEKAGLIVTPGIGFGPSGDHYIRVSGLGPPSLVREAAARIDLMNL